MNSLFERFLDTCFSYSAQLFYPFYCRSCLTLIHKNQVVCEPCEKKISSVATLILPITTTISLPVFALGAYQEPLRSLILRKTTLDTSAFYHLAQLILKKVSLTQRPLDYIIPVPLHWTRYASRGYNQAEIIASALSQGLNVPLFTGVKRVFRTEFQSRLGGKKRQENVKNAFTLLHTRPCQSPSLLEDKHLLLVDDLCTTGATLKNVARCLLAFKPKSLSAVVGARAT